MTKAVNERELVLDIVMEVMEKGGFSHLVIKDVLDKYAYLEKRERSFLSKVALGTIEYALQMDTILNQRSKTPVHKMKPLIRNLLRMSVYQILYLDSVPDSAVCNEAVKLAKRRGFSGLSGFVNGVLRSLVREKEKITFTSMSEKYSMPEWLIERWRQDYTKEVIEGMLAAFLEKKTISIRCNRDKISPEELQRQLMEEGVHAEVAERIPEAMVLTSVDSIEGLSAFQRGLFQVQDLSSMLAVQKAGIMTGDYVIDVCAAPGGKSLYASELLGEAGMVEARDLTEYKKSLIEENMQRSGRKNIRAAVWDARELDEASVGTADVVLADLPCSGLGVIGRKPDIKYKVTPEQIQQLVQLQREILATIHTYPKVGGTLLYSTCTISREENQENVRWFLENYPYELEGEAEQLLPGLHNLDGFFFAKMIRKE